MRPAETVDDTARPTCSNDDVKHKTVCLKWGWCHDIMMMMMMMTIMLMMMMIMMLMVLMMIMR